MSSIARNPGELRQHDTVFSMPLDVDPFQGTTTSGSGVVEWLRSGTADKDCVHITQNNVTASSVSTSRRIHVSKLDEIAKLGGSELVLRFLLKGSAISSGWKPWIIIKGTSAIYGASPRYINSSEILTADHTGTFDWVEVNYTFDLNSDFIPEYWTFGVTAPANTSGEAWIAGIRITVMSGRDTSRPAPSSYTQTLNGYRGFQINPNPTRKDFFDLKSTYNANFIRFQFNTWSASDNPQLVDKTDLTQWDAWLAAKLVIFANARTWAKQNDIKMVVSLMTYPGGPDVYSVSQMQYQDVYYQKYLEFWRNLTTICLNDSSVIAFDVHNEPAYGYRLRPQGPSRSFRSVIHDVIKEIRKVDPTRTIIVEPEKYSDPNKFKYLKPYPFDNLIYSFHMYRPSHYTDSGNTTQSYPGLVISTAVYKNAGLVDAGTGHVVDKDFLRDILQSVRDFQLSYHVPIYAGEFSAPRWVPGCAAYLADLASIFDEWGWIWTYHAFREANSWDVEYEAMPASQVGAVQASSTTDRAQSLITALSSNVSKYTALEQAPIAPVFTITETWNDSVTINWVPASVSIQSFNVEYKQTTSEIWTSISVARDKTSHEIPGLVPGTSYDFRVVLVNAYGTADASTQTLIKGITYMSSLIQATPTRAYSVRKVMSNYSGPLVRVRRSSDNLEQDIFADVNGFLDTTALLSFVGTGSGFVTTLYDQSGTGKHLLQPTQARQPRVVNSGVVDLVNGVPSFNFITASSHWLSQASATMYDAGSSTMIGVVRNNASAADTYIACESHSTAGVQFYSAVSGSTASNDVKISCRDNAGVIFAGSGGAASVGGFLSGTLRQFVLVDTGTSVRIASNINNEIQDTTYSRSGRTVTLNQFGLGCRLRAAGTDKFANMNLCEFLCFDSALSQNDKDAIKANHVRAFALS